MKVNFNKVLEDAGMPTTEEAIKKEFDAVVADAELITNNSQMSPFWRLITSLVIKPYITLKDALINNVLANMFLMTAENWALDLYAQGVNLTRKQASKTTGFITFYKSDINQQVAVKKGTVIQSPEINGQVFELITTKDETIESGKASALIEVEAVEAGSAYNLAPNYYKILTEEVNGIEAVNNLDNWIKTPGTDVENSTDFKERIKNQYNLVGHYHTDAVYRGLVSQITGIATNQIYFVHDAPRGPGTANIYLLLNDGEASNGFIAQVNDFIMNQGHHGHGDDLQCFAMPEKRIDITAQIYFKNEQMPQNIDDYLIDVENMIRSAFRQNKNYNVTKTSAFSRFSISNLDRELHETFPEIKSIIFDVNDLVTELEVIRLNELNMTYGLAE